MSWNAEEGSAAEPKIEGQPSKEEDAQVVEMSKGMTVQVVTKVRQNKDKSQSYTDIAKIMVV